MLRLVPLGIWFRNNPPPEAALLLRRVAADNDRALVALLPAMPPPSVAQTPVYQTTPTRCCVTWCEVSEDIRMLPDSLCAVLKLKVDPMTDCCSLSVMNRPPPLPAAVFDVKLEDDTVSVLSLQP
jgi:hypothetical protein